MSLKHSLHRKPTDAKLFYSVYFGLIVVAAGLVLTPGAPLGLLTNAVQTLAGVLLPSATVFLLLLCNDKAVLGPWTNGRALNLFTGAVIALLVILSIILTVSVLFPEAADEKMIVGVIVGGALAGLAFFAFSAFGRKVPPAIPARSDKSERASWRMPPLDELPAPNLSRGARLWMIAIRLYLLVAGGLVLARIVSLALSHG